MDIVFDSPLDTYIDNQNVVLADKVENMLKQINSKTERRKVIATIIYTVTKDKKYMNTQKNLIFTSLNDILDKVDIIKDAERKKLQAITEEEDDEEKRSGKMNIKISTILSPTKNSKGTLIRNINMKLSGPPPHSDIDAANTYLEDITKYYNILMEKDANKRVQAYNNLHADQTDQVIDIIPANYNIGNLEKTPDNATTKGGRRKYKHTKSIKKKSKSKGRKDKIKKKIHKTLKKKSK